MEAVTTLDLRARFQAAVESHQRGDTSAAEAEYRALLAHDSRHAGALHLLGVIHHQRAEYAEAIRLIGSALVLEPARATYHNNLGAALLARGDTEAAERSFEQAVALEPGYADAHANLGLARLQGGRFDDAHASLTEALRLQPQHADALERLADCLLAQDDPSEAVRVLLRAKRARSDCGRLANKLGVALALAGKTPEAQEAFRQARARNPQYGLAAYNEGVLAGAWGPRGTYIRPYAHLGRPAPSPLLPVRRLGVGKRVFLAGYPGDMGGANTEAWNALRVWRALGAEVRVIPLRASSFALDRRLAELGIEVCGASGGSLENIASLAGSLVISFAKEAFLERLGAFHALDCRTVWLGCMPYVSDPERRAFQRFGLPRAMVFQSRYQRGEYEAQLRRLGFEGVPAWHIPGSFVADNWEFSPRPHRPHEPFVVGKVARPDPAKWPARLGSLIERIGGPEKRALLLGVDDKIHAKLAPSLGAAVCLPPQALPVREFLPGLHAFLARNDGATENWPQVGLEAMAAGVPVVAENRGGWPEMIEHGVTGFLAGSDDEFVEHLTVLATEEALRQRIAQQARHALTEKLANPARLARQWVEVFERVGFEP